MDQTADILRSSEGARPLFGKLLVANRGEIACRIVRTARRLRIPSVAVYSDADADALHVRMADEALRIGPASPAESYLCPDAILRAARESGAEAVHPGYGFLSENAAFAEQIADAGLTFVGPPASAIRAMGAKNAAKRLMEDSGVPVVPGYHGEDQDSALLLREAQKIGFPVLIKPVAGGGGKGMRAAVSAEDFPPRLAESRREAAASFGSAAVIVERLIRRPRHIEVQVFGDSHGRVVHLFERDCTLQRRHQKIFEECPAPGIRGEFRAAVCAAAVAAARAIGYIGAGTVEFIADGTDGLSEDRFWFMEMNTRLQVEHPVTEEALGIDLVEWQLLAAAGLELPAGQIPDRPVRCAVEARIYAEDPANNFLPSAGRVVRADMPDFIRVDSGIEPGDRITPHYDPMIAKFIASGASREEARRKLLEGLRRTDIRGVATNTALLSDLADCGEFVQGASDTGTVERRYRQADSAAEPSQHALALAAAGMAGLTEEQNPETGFALWQGMARKISFRLGDRLIDSEICVSGPDRFAVELPDGSVECRRLAEGWQLNGQQTAARVIPDSGQVHVFLDGIWKFAPSDPLDVSSEDGSAGDCVRAPMPGFVTSILAEPGMAVEAGDALAIMEAMKMELTLHAPQAGIVAEILVPENSQVAEGADIIRLDSESGAIG